MELRKNRQKGLVDGACGKITISKIATEACQVRACLKLEKKMARCKNEIQQLLKAKYKNSSEDHIRPRNSQDEEPTNNGPEEKQVSEIRFKQLHENPKQVSEILSKKLHENPKQAPGRPFKCSECSYSAGFLQVFLAHKRIHTGERPFKCNFCPASFPHYTSLVSHRRQHTGERPYPCRICNYSGTQQNCLRVHMKGHTEKNAFKCSMCPYWTSSPGLTHKHERTCHNGKYVGAGRYLDDKVGRSKPAMCKLESKAISKKIQSKVNVSTFSSELALSRDLALQEFEIDGELIKKTVAQCDVKLQHLAVVKLSGKSNLRGQF
ncbi:unnamed protein product [Allacma fusca]|uniref:C2H2-type domain-containing protein n=1 Tax=Allacma fusca TaxID=39272 RepID=A0A8J2L706_9HEXA|nr:unnamed protein product [Allacma fusca]